MDGFVFYLTIAVDHVADLLVEIVAPRFEGLFSVAKPVHGGLAEAVSGGDQVMAVVDLLPLLYGLFEIAGSKVPTSADGATMEWSQDHLVNGLAFFFSRDDPFGCSDNKFKEQVMGGIPAALLVCDASLTEFVCLVG